MTAATVRGLIEAGQGGWVPRGLTGPTSDELRSLCKDAGWGFVEVRLAGVADKPDLMRTLARQLELPAYFGGNWDALEECLGDVLAGGDLEHHRLQQLLHDGAQTARPGAAGDGQAGDLPHGVVREVQADVVEGEHPLVLLGQGVARLGEHPSQVLLPQLGRGREEGRDRDHLHR